MGPKLEMQLTVGKLAFFPGNLYQLVAFGLIVSTAAGHPIPLVG